MAKSYAAESIEKAIEEAEEKEKKRSLLKGNYFSEQLGFLLHSDALNQILICTIFLTIQYVLSTVILSMLMGDGGWPRAGMRVGIFVAVLWLGMLVYLAGLVRAVICDTANGEVVIESWVGFGQILDHSDTLCMLFSSLLLSHLVSGIVSILLASVGVPYIACFVLIVLPFQFLLYPFFLISMMEATSIFLPASREVFEGLKRFPSMWIPFYCESGVVLLVVVTSSALLAFSFVFCPIVAFVHTVGLLVYHRALGRLSYRLATAIAKS